MKLSVSAFRAQASAQRKILINQYQNQLNYGACTSFPALRGVKLDEKPQMLAESSGIGPPTSRNPNDPVQSSNTSSQEEADDRKEMAEDEKEKAVEAAGNEGTNHRRREDGLDKSPGRTRTKSNQRWMKLRTTVQLSGAITNQSQKSKPGLKREDSFLKRFSTRQIPETQETVDTGDDAEMANGSQTHNEVSRRRRKKRKELSKTVVNPDENFYFYWLMTVTVCVLYNLWTLIVRQSFPELQRNASAFWYMGDGFTDVIFVCDIVVQFRTGYLEQGLMVYDSKKLATHYLKSRAFILDILSLLPLDFLQWKLGVNPILRFPRFLKIYRIYSYYYMVESRTVYPNLWRVVNLIHILLILAHWFGCFYYLLSEAEGFQGDWVYPYRQGDYATLTRKYLGSLYWSTLTLTTIGDLPTPETNAESRGGGKAMISSGDSESVPRRGHKSRLLQFNSNYGYLFTIVSYLIGVFIFATIVGQVGNVITNRNANRLEFERLLDGAKTYMRHHKVPGGMKRRVLRWYDYSWSRGRIQGGGDINTALGLLPDKLKTELALHVNLSVLKKVTIFQECQPEFLHDLVLKMKAYIFTPGDLICRKGEVAREMFIIADGILDVISETGRVLTTMKAGDFFGEIGILNLDGLNKRTADVRSVGYSELFSLSREDVLTAMKDYPEAQEILQNLGRKRLMEAKNASKMHKVQARQNKDHDSSGDSDNAGKRIVEKLRSDVKGLKNAFRRSRRGTRTKEGLDGYGDSGVVRTQGKKQSILRRMSHVQSSDEFDINNEVAQSPIGAGLPLLQRLKCLKEKQEREKEERAKLKGSAQGASEKEEESETETAENELPLTQRTLKFFKQKEEATAATGATVRTQQTGLASYPAKNVEEDKNSGMGSTTVNVKDTGDVRKIALMEKIRLGVKERSLPLKNAQEADASGSPFSPESKTDLPKNASTFVPAVGPEEGNSAENSVPKISLKSKFEVPKSKDAWKLLKKSSITSSRLKRIGGNPIRKVTKKGTYLSKSDTVLERQRTLDKEGDKRSRSISPPEDSNFSENFREMDEEGNDDQTKYDQRVVGSQAWKDSARFECAIESAGFMKKYDSISDLSPEYSGLPFVKKLKILNERQKLAELEKELLVRSASLDVPDRQQGRRANVLIRSQSEASTIEIKSPKNIISEEEKRIFISSAGYMPSGTLNPRNIKTPGKGYSEESMASPESNETMERRHLKSILKKLSAEESTSDEEITRLEYRKGDKIELRKLMRAPTVEGYAARHKKLTKSVTFDSETLSSPPEPVITESLSADDSKTKGFPPLSTTAVFTLQLSNLSMIPILGLKNVEKKDEEKIKLQVERVVSKMLKKLQEEIGKLRKSDVEKGKVVIPYQVQEFEDRNFRLLPFAKGQSNEEFFSEILLGVQQIIQGTLVEAENNHQIEKAGLEMEIKKRDEIIKQLQEKLQEFEERDSTSRPDNGSLSNTDDHGGKYEEVFDSKERGYSESVINAISPLSKPTNFEEKYIWEEGASSTTYKEFRDSEEEQKSIGFLNYLALTKKESELEGPEADTFDMKEKINNFPKETGSFMKPRIPKSLESASEDECELLAVPKTRRFDRKQHKRDFELKRNWSVDESQMGSSSSKAQSHWSNETKSNENREKTEFRWRGKKMFEKMSEFHRSFSCTQEKDFFALDIDDSSTSSDVEQPDNKDWEIQMLVEELEKKEPDWDGNDWMLSATEAGEVEHIEDMMRLQEEVDTLKEMVCQSDLTRLSDSELDMLETIIEAKDRKVSQIAKSNSLDDPENQPSRRHCKGTRTSALDSGNKSIDGRKKPTLRQKLGQALSFDFHDISGRKSKSPDRGRIKSFSLGKPKNGSQNFWPTSNLLKNRMMDGTSEIGSQLTGSSLPILMSSSPGGGKRSDLRTSLPSLSAKDVNLLESKSLPGGSFEESDQFKESCDSVFDPADIRHASTGEAVRLPHEGHSNVSGLNNFIRSVGQKVKQVMTGDSSAVRNQVPTISKLCDQRLAPGPGSLKNIELEDEDQQNDRSPRKSAGEESQPKSSNNKDPFHFHSNTEPPDL